MNKLGGDIALGDGGTSTRNADEEDRQKRIDAITAGQLNALAVRCGNTADSKGFHQPVKDADALDQISRMLAGTDGGMTVFTTNGNDPVNDGQSVSAVLQRIASQHRMMHLGWKLMLIASELGEAAESLRKTGVEGIGNSDDDNFGEELADSLIRLVDLAALAGVPIGDVTLDKMGVNTTRPMLHGKKG